MQLDGPRRGPAAGGPARQLVVLCHGFGNVGEQLIDLVPALAEALPHAAFAAPDGPEPCEEAAHVRQWFQLRDRRPTVLLAGAAAAAAPLDRFVDSELARLGLPPDAYALVGFSQGAMLVLHAGLRRPTPPRVVIAYAGALLAGRSLPGINPAPVLLVHGDADEVVPAVRSQVAERTLRDAGVPVEAVFLPGLGHVIDERAVQAGADRLRRAFDDAA